MSAQTRDILKVVLEGYVASFRYPHFIQGVHPTYEMPPPATIYGLITGVLGEYFAPDAVRFAYHFTYRTKFEDYEHLHFPPSEIKKKEERALYKQIRAEFGTADMPPAINPFVRELLYEPRLTLYLDRMEIGGIDLINVFREPRYPVVLGRSQDLMTVSQVKVVTLHQTDRCFVSGTLLTLADAAQIGGQFYAVTMPRYISPDRRPEWAQYAVLPDTRRPRLFPDPEETLISGELPPEIWVDEEERHPLHPDAARAVYWHGWTG